jgi:glucose dehydrogenase
MSRTLCVLAILAGISTLGACGRGHDLDDAALRAADADSAEWLSYGRTYTEQRHSPLTQVDEQSVSRLGLAWSVDLQRNWGITVPGIVDIARAETRSDSSHVGLNDR